MSQSDRSAELVTVVLSPADCHALCEMGPHWLPAESASDLMDKLDEAEALAVWLREDARVDLSSGDAELLGELRRRAARSRQQIA